MQVDVDASFKLNHLIGLILIMFTVDTVKSANLTPNRQMCSKLESMLSFGKYQTYQISSNITYVSRVYSQNFLAYSPLDDLLVFIEPKHQIHVYNAQTVRLIVNLTTTDVVFAASCVSLSSDDRHDLYFIYESRLQPNLVSIRVCQVHFNRSKSIFENKNCIETLKIPWDKPDIRINGFTIKRDHAGTKKSILFISTDIGLIYTIFNTHTGSLTREPTLMNDTLTEGSIVLSSSGTVYYANKQAHTIHELLITRDFRLRNGKMIKSNAIKYPFGLITDECNHLYIATKSMILVMYVQTYKTIRSVFSKASDLSITIERLNSTTYVYATVKKNSGRIPSLWMFNFLYFTDPEKPVSTTRSSVVETEPKFYFDDAETDSIDTTDLSSLTTYTQTISPVEDEISWFNETNIITENLSTEYLTSDSLNGSQETSSLSSIQLKTDHDEEISTISPFFSTEYLHSPTSTSTFSMTGSFDVTQSNFLSTTDAESILLATTSETTFEYLSSVDAVYNSSDPATVLSTSLSMTISNDDIDQTTEDRINQNYSSPLLVEVNVSSTLNSPSPFDISDTTFIPSYSTPLSSLLHRSSTHSSTTSSELNRLSSSTHFLETTTVTSLPTTLPSSISTLQSSYLFSSLQTTALVITSDTSEQSSMTTLPDESSSPLITSHLSSTSTTPFTTTDNQYTSTQPNNLFESSSLSYTIYSETSTAEYQSISTTAITSTNLDSTPILLIGKSSTPSLITTMDEENLASTDSLPLETTQLPSTITDEYQEGYTSTESSFEMTSTVSLHVPTSQSVHSSFAVIQSSPLSNRPTRKKPYRRMTTITSIPSTTTTTTTTTKRRYRTRKQKTTGWITQQSTITFFDYKLLTSSSIPILHSKLNSLPQKQHTLVITPSLITNTSNTLLSDDLLNTLLQTNTSASIEKSIYFNLMDLPPSSWNLSLQTNQSILLDLALPSSSHPSNLTFTNLQANRLSANILGFPVNLQAEEIHAKQFSLVMNITNNDQELNNQTKPPTSDVVIGHVKSEQFELNMTKSDNMNVHVRQVDTATAELYFDSQFCSNESSLQINLNLSKNGTIRYGNQPPIRIGSAFTRLHMLKQSCHLDQPFVLFFDICQRQNPCSNGGTCESLVPDYDNPSYSRQGSSEINYRCICPVHTLGEHCQYPQYPSVYCLQGGSLIQTFDSNNKSNEKCLCLNGFQGDHCEENIDDCINIDCSKHGMCQDGINTYACSCFDGFYGDYCEHTTVETVLLQVASKSFAVVAILLISGIASLFVASDIHTYLTRKKQENNHHLNRIPRAKSELFENSVLLLGFGDAPIEMSDLSTVDRRKKTTTITQRPINLRKPAGYQQLSKKKSAKTLIKRSPRHYLLTNQSFEL